MAQKFRRQQLQSKQTHDPELYIKAPNGMALQSAANRIRNWLESEVQASRRTGTLAPVRDPVISSKNIPRLTPPVVDFKAVRYRNFMLQIEQSFDVEDDNFDFRKDLHQRTPTRVDGTIHASFLNLVCNTNDLV